MNTTQTREQIREAYAASGRQYDEVRLTDPRGALLSEHDVQLVMNMWPNLPKDVSLLEIGAGTGRFTTHVLNLGYSVVATDINETMLDELRTKVRELGQTDRCTIRNEDVFNLSFSDGEFELAYSFHVIPRFLNVEDQRAALLEIGRTIRPGGMLFFNYRNRRSPYNLLYKGHAISPQEIRDILADAGFVITRQWGKHLSTRSVFNRLPMFLNRCLSWIDTKLHRFASNRAWDVFVIATKQPAHSDTA